MRLGRRLPHVLAKVLRLRHGAELLFDLPLQVAARRGKAAERRSGLRPDGGRREEKTEHGGEDASDHAATILPREGHDGVGAARRAAGGRERLPHHGRLLAETAVREHALDRRAESGRRRVRFRQIEARAELFHSSSDRFLLPHLGDHHERHTEVEALADAVHAAVRDECRCALEHLQLGDVGLHADVGRRRAQARLGDVRADRHHDLDVHVPEGVEAVPVESRVRVEQRAERDIDERRLRSAGSRARKGSGSGRRTENAGRTSRQRVERDARYRRCSSPIGRTPAR